MNGREVAMDSFGTNLKKHRLARNVTLREVGHYIGKSVGYISDIEHDRKRPPDLETVSKMEDFLGVEDGSLLTLAKKWRQSIIPNLSRSLKQNQKLTYVLLRAEQLPENELDNLIEQLKKKEEK